MMVHYLTEKSDDLTTIIGKWFSPQDHTLGFQIEIELLEDLTFIYTIISNASDLEDIISEGTWKFWLDRDSFEGRLIIQFYNRSIGDYTFIYIPKIYSNKHSYKQSTIDLLKSTKEKSTENLDYREVLFLQDDAGGKFIPYFKK